MNNVSCGLVTQILHSNIKPYRYNYNNESNKNKKGT